MTAWTAMSRSGSPPSVSARINERKILTNDTQVHSVTALELDRYLGTWFEIGRLPLRFEDDDATNVTATYSLNDGGTVRVDNRCLDEDGKPTQAIGEGLPVDEHPGRLKVTFLPEGLRWIPFTKADYWVLQIDPEYRYALVGTPDHKYLWFLSRTPQVDTATTQQYLDAAKQQGFNLDDWIATAQTGGHVTDEMLDAA